jgi:hypothetical protein
MQEKSNQSRSEFLNRDCQLLAAVFPSAVLLPAVGAALDLSFVLLGLFAAFDSAADWAFASGGFASIDVHKLLRA